MPDPPTGRWRCPDCRPVRRARLETSGDENPRGGSVLTTSQIGLIGAEPNDAQLSLLEGVFGMPPGTLANRYASFNSGRNSKRLVLHKPSDDERRRYAQLQVCRWFG